MPRRQACEGHLKSRSCNAQRDGDCAPRLGWRGSGVTKASGTKPAIFLLRSMAGSPKASARAILRRLKPCSTRWHHDPVEGPERLPLLALNGHPDTFTQCPLLGVKRTSLLILRMSVPDPTETFAAQFAVPHNKLPLRSFGFVEKRLHRFE